MKQATARSTTQAHKGASMMPGQRYALLTAISFHSRTDYGKAKWLFQCDCGREHIALLDNVKFGRTQSCGCLRPVAHIEAGKRYGDLIAIRPLPRDMFAGNAWQFRCDCGSDAVTLAHSVASGKVQSCGCRKHRVPFKHGQVNTPEYDCWKNLLRRCTNPRHPSFPNYGGRGIQVCKKWEADFAAFIADVGPRPSSKHSLDRFPDNNGHYEPGNVRWATRVEQALNRRTTRRVIYEGVEMPLAEACQITGMAYNSAVARLRIGWSVDRALHEPVNHKCRPHNIKRSA